MLHHFAKISSFSRRFSLAHAQTVIRSSISPTLERALKYKVGDNISGYNIKQITEVPELQLVALRLEHENTGADHLHIAREDQNNVFSVNFKTIIENSRGVAHILEHLALCGSKNFPCRDPFFNMLGRSLSTFMNAMTGLDTTYYPFSTMNPKDYENLMKVYLDATFFPCLREKDFMQEGWRLDHEEAGNENSPIILKGVVFNEMKGVYSDPNQYYVRKLMQHVYPSHSYSHCSGGEPLHIPELTWNELKSFHAEHYHPSNSRFYTYGNFPLESHLKLINDFVLKHFNKAAMNKVVIPEKRWSKPREATIYCDFNPMAADPEKQTTVSHTYLLNDITDISESFTLGVIGNLLVDGPNSPFYKSLIESGLGADFSPYTGFEGQLRQSFFSIGLKDVHKDDVHKVEEKIQATFDEVVNDGFPKERIEAFLHNVELSLKHQKTKFGLSLIMAINDLWNHGGDPVELLKVNKKIEWFQDQLQTNPLYLQDKVDQYFRKNNHRLCLIMTPDKTEVDKVKKEEENFLQTKLNSLSKEDKDLIFKNSIELEKHQLQNADVNILPTLKISDVEKTIEFTPLSWENLNGVSVQVCEQPTNGVTYFKTLCKIPKLPEDLQLLLPIFSTILTRMGAGDLDYRQFDQKADLTTGGLHASVHLSPHPSIEGKYEYDVLLSSHCLQRNMENMMDLWQLVINSLKLTDHDRLSQLIKMCAASLADSIPQNGHGYAMTKSNSCLNEYFHLNEKMSGISQVLYMKKLAELTNYDEVISKLKLLSNVILNKESMRCALNTNSESMSSSISTLNKFFNSIEFKNTKVESPLMENFNPKSEKFHFVLPFNVNYIGHSFITKPYSHKDFVNLNVASTLLSLKFLHKEIREKGGAYGGGVRIDMGGAMMFYSYRDPNVSKTLESFNKSLRWLVDGKYSSQDIDEAKLGVFKSVDHPVAPGSRGMNLFLNSVSDEMKQELRERLFSVNQNDIVSALQKYMSSPKIVGTTLIGPKNELSNNKEWTCISE